MHTLLLNYSFEPLNVVSWQKAIQLLFQGKVEVVEESEQEIRSVRITMKVPAVLRLLKFTPIYKQAQIIRFSRANVFLRDQHRCQYCGHKYSKNNLTLDHVIPVVQGGQKSWENIVTACKPCNQKKGGRTPSQAKMKLTRNPKEPTWLPKTSFFSIDITLTPESWKIYLHKG